MIIDYWLIVVRSAVALDEAVRGAIQDDWQPLGTPSITCGPLRQGGYEMYYYQAMVKYEEEE